MAFRHSPTVTKNGLVFYLDAANPKSYTSGSTSWLDLTSPNSGSLIYGPTFGTSNMGTILFPYGTYIYTNRNINFTQGTISCWIKPMQTNNNFFVYTSSDPSTAYSHQLGIKSNNKLNVYIYDGSIKQFEASSSLSLNTWYNLVFYWNDYNSFGTYVNGTFQGSMAINQAWKGGAIFLIASYCGTANNANGWFSGSIANFSIYDRLLSTSEILNNYDAMKGRFGLT